MRVLTCFLPPSAGTASLAGYDVLEQPLEVKRRIGYLPETPPLYPEMEVAEYLTFVGRLKGVPGSAIAGAWTRFRACAPSATCAISSSASSRRGTGSGSDWRRPSSTTPTC